MSPEAARVFIAEDNGQWREFFRTAVTAAGHEVVIEVNNVEDGLAAVSQALELGVNVALIDGRLPYGELDGMLLTRALKNAFPPNSIKVIDVSLYGAVKNADGRITKKNFSQDEGALGKLVTEI